MFDAKRVKEKFGLLSLFKKMFICSTFVSNSPLAQLVERGANNGKVLS